MEKKTTDHGPIAWGFGLGLGLVIGHYMPEHTTWWQNLLIFAVVVFGPLLWIPNSKN